jgi:hypothetical protein
LEGLEGAFVGFESLGYLGYFYVFGVHGGSCNLSVFR